jgi:hypothetical protein
MSESCVRVRGHSARPTPRLLETWGSSADRQQVIILRAYSLAYAGQMDTAGAEAERPLAVERQLGLQNAYLPFVFARICVLAGRHDQAGQLLEEVLRLRDYYSRPWLRIDLTFAPLRNNARFVRLVAWIKTIDGQATSTASLRAAPGAASSPAT